MIEMSKGVYKDLNGNSQKDRYDQYGTVVYPIYADVFYFGAGLKTTEINEDGIPVLSDDFTNGKIHDMIVKLSAFVHENPDAFMPPIGVWDDFEKGCALFFPVEVSLAITNLRDTTFGYGILPSPKSDEAQESYYTVSSFPYVPFGIPKDAVNVDRASAVMEALASESYRTLTPALFETAMKVKYSDDERDARMYDIIKGTVVYDFGRIFNDSMSGLTATMWRDCVIGNNTNWTSVWESNKESLATMLADVVSNFDK